MYAALRLLYSRIGQPYAGTASYFSFNDPNGMCKTCSGIGKILDLDIERAIDPDKSWNESMLMLPAFGVGNYYWKQADWLIDVGPDGGTAGGEVVFTGTPKEIAEQAQTITAEYLRKSL